MFYVFVKFQIGNHIGLMDSWKTLIVFFFKNREIVKMHSIIRHPISPYPTPPFFLYTLRTVDHPKRNLKLFCLKSKITFFFLPIYSKIGCRWGITSRSIMIYLDRNVIFSERSIILVTCIFSVKCFLFPIRYGQWTVDRNLPCPQRWTFFTKKLKHIPYVAQAYR